MGLTDFVQRLSWLATYAVVQGVGALLAVFAATFSGGLFSSDGRLGLFALLLAFNCALGSMSLAIAALVPSPKTATTISIASLSKAPTLALCVEKPPVAIVVSAWLTASSGLMPRANRITASTAVNRT